MSFEPTVVHRLHLGSLEIACTNSPELVRGTGCSVLCNLSLLVQQLRPGISITEIDSRLQLKKTKTVKVRYTVFRSY
jgi:hypothetical protein